MARYGFGCILLLGGACSKDDAPAVDHPTVDRAPVALSAPVPSAAPEPTAPVSRKEQPRCADRVVVEPGDSFESISRRCYGSRTYQAWLMAHNHREKEALRAGETLDVPAFATLAGERVAAQWGTHVAAIAEAFTHYRNVQSDIERQLRGQRSGMGSYRPDARAKAELDAAASALRPVVARLREAGVRTKKFAQAVEELERLAKGEGSFSTDYATESIHQCFSYGIDALR